MKHFSLLLLLSICSFPLVAQFQLNGSATQTSPNCFTITPDLIGQSGSVWNTTLIDLNKPFELYADIFLGCKDGIGADGIVFAFQPVSTGAGTTGGGMGYQGIAPSFAVEFDTWQNNHLSDPVADHMAIISDGVVNHAAAANLVGPVSMLPGNGNTEDCMFHDVHISWNPVTDSFLVYFDCNLRLVYVGDIVSVFFSGNPFVYWGVTAATGGSSNLQQMCFESFFNGFDQTICEGDTLTLDAGPGSGYAWSPNIGITDSTVRTPGLFPSVPTTYTVNYLDLCGNPQTRSYIFDVIPDSLLNIDLGSDTSLCAGQSLMLDAYRPGPSYLWQDGSTDSVFTVNNPGLFWVELSNSCGARRDSIQISPDFPPVVDLGTDTTLCTNATLILSSVSVNATYLWQDGTTGIEYTVNSPGTYWLESTNICGTNRDSITVTYLDKPEPFNLGADTILCGTATLQLDATQTGSSYQWQDNSTNPTFTVSAPGQYWVDVINICGLASDSINVTYDIIPDIELGNDTIFCGANLFQLDASWTPGSSYLWQDGSTGPTYFVTDPGTYQVTVTNTCGSDVSDIVIDYKNPPPAIDLGGDQPICAGQTIVLDSKTTGFDHLWQNGTTGTTLEVKAPGMYSVVVSNFCGASTDTVTIFGETLPVVDLGRDTILCDGNGLVLNAVWPGATYLWDNGSTGGIRSADVTGIYSVDVSNSCGTVSDEIAVEFKTAPQPVSLGDDRQLCTGDSLLLDVSQPDVSYQWQNGSTEPIYTIRFEGTYWVVARNGCGEERDEVTITYAEPPAPDLGPDRILCDGDSFEVDVRTDWISTFLWQDGSQDSRFTIDRGGVYRVEVRNACGTEIDSLVVTDRMCNCQVYVPSGFTPNGDGFNDGFRFYAYCDIQRVHLKLFDRWGALVFESNQPETLWDGQYKGAACPEGVYVWVMEYEYQGQEEINEVVQEKGTLTLLR